MPKADSTTPKLELRPSGGIVLRTPRLPRDVLDAWSACARDVDPGVLRMRLRDIVVRADVREAIYVASPSLEASIDAWIAAPTTEDGRKTERGLVRYISRMTTRPTPFGLFAGNTVGTIGATTTLALGPADSYRRYTRLDGDYLSSLCDALARLPEVRARLKHRPNTSLFCIAGDIRYAMRREGDQRTYTLVRIDPTPHIVATIERARSGALPCELAKAICDDEPDVELHEANVFIDELIASQVLLPELAPLITGDEALDDVITQLAALGLAETHAVLRDLRDALRSIDDARVTPPARYRELAVPLANLPAKPRIDRLIQVNLVPAGSDIVLGRDIVDEVISAVELMCRMSPQVDTDELVRFREAFIERYDTREVELVEVLDEDAGIGFGVAHTPATSGSPLFAGITFPAEPPSQRVAWTPALAHLAHLVGLALENQMGEVVLDATDLAVLKNARTQPRLPDSLFAMLAITRAPDGELRVECVAAGGPPGVALLGRFAHSDPEIRKVIDSNTAAEAALKPNVVFAEIAHLAEGRLANISARPVLRSHEIVYLGRSGAQREDQLKLTDLLVSVRGGRVVLRSKRLGAFVEPRLSTAHNVSSNTLGPYRFLAAVQRQGCTIPRFDIGPLAALPRVPQIRIGRVILRPASWTIRKFELATLAAAHGRERVAGIERLRADRHMPRWVGLSDGDNVLPVDFDNALSVDSFLHLVHAREQVRLVEIPQAAEELVATGDGGRYAAEIVVPLVRTSSAPVTAPLPCMTNERHCFAPGSDWLYAKLYTGRAGADRVLEALARVVGNLPRWFFVRYADPEWHLRVRVHGDPRWLATHAFPSIAAAAQPLLNSGAIWKLQFDTYEREIERYGGPIGIDLAEQLFHSDSVCALGVLAALESVADPNARWRLAAVSIEHLLDCFEVGLDRRYALLRGMSDNFAAEHRIDVVMRRSLGDKFRTERQGLADVLSPVATDNVLAPAIANFLARSAAVVPIVTELRVAEKSGALTTPIFEMLPSYIHMSVNRLLRDAHRAHEAVLYDLLARHYESQLARSRRTS